MFLNLKKDNCEYSHLSILLWTASRSYCNLFNWLSILSIACCEVVLTSWSSNSYVPICASSALSWACTKVTNPVLMIKWSNYKYISVIDSNVFITCSVCAFVLLSSSISFLNWDDLCSSSFKRSIWDCRTSQSLHTATQALWNYNILIEMLNHNH